MHAKDAEKKSKPLARSMREAPVYSDAEIKTLGQHRREVFEHFAYHGDFLQVSERCPEHVVKLLVTIDSRINPEVAGLIACFLMPRKWRAACPCVDHLWTVIVGGTEENMRRVALRVALSTLRSRFY